ncbi:DNA-binding protein [Selenomonas artemidis]|jgi:hypothetical protein|uniref:DNA-binding protein n=1 Tax=Selenomonas artemidis TaxID=671224 RepID=UPI0028D60667|nr:DNA-binding protein [Selenomonas artemidis]
MPTGYKTAKSNFITAPEIADVCAISVSKAYKILAELNADLQKMGKCTLRGKTNRRYFEMRYLDI